MKCKVCGNEAGKNKLGIPKDYCKTPCLAIGTRPGKSIKKPKYCTNCGRSREFCECIY